MPMGQPAPAWAADPPLLPLLLMGPPPPRQQQDGAGAGLLLPAAKKRPQARHMPAGTPVAAPNVQVFQRMDLMICI